MNAEDMRDMTGYFLERLDDDGELNEISRRLTKNNIVTSLMEDVVTYTKQLRGWSLFVWCVFWPQKWWVRGYERGWTAALKLVEGQKKTGEEGIEPPTHGPRHLYQS